jgi:iron-sulfur cluster assembly accessory protein
MFACFLSGFSLILKHHIKWRSSVLKVSDIAAEKAKEILKAEGKEGWGLRVFIHGAGCCGPSYGMDIDEKASEGDETVEKNGLKVFVDKEASVSLSEKEIDYVKTEQGEGFVINGNEPPPSCGSGCSSCG